MTPETVSVGLSRLVVDGFERDLVVCTMEDGRPLDLPRSWLPSGIRQGDRVTVRVTASGDGGGLVQFALEGPEPGAEP